MVNDDLRLRGMSAVLLGTLFACGCFETRMSDGVMKTTPPVAFQAATSPATANDDAVTLAVARPARPGAASSSAATDGPDLNPIQQTAANADAPPATEQAPPPRPQPTDVKQAPAPAAANATKDPPAPAPPGPGPVPPNGHYKPDPAFAVKKPAPQPGMAGLVPPAALANDPHRRVVPTAAGGLLNLPPGESPAERALELNARLSELDTERQALEVRARELGAALEDRDRALVQHGHDIREAAREVARAREQVAGWRKDLEDARARLRNRDLEDVQTLKAIIAVLERLTDAGPEPKHESGAARVPEE